MSGPSDFQPTNPALRWIERRLPIMGLVHSSFVAYPTPRNLNYWWTFGAILSMMLGLQILTGVILAMHYTPEATMAFKSVEHRPRRQLRLAAPQHARQRRLDVLSRRLHAHV